MHEATIAQSILNILHAKLSQAPQAIAVIRARIVVGEFRNVDHASLEFAFDAMKPHYEKIAGCKLDIECTRAQALCNSYKHSYYPDFNNAYRCSHCGDSIGELIQGNELYIEGITMDSPSPAQVR